MYLGKILWQYGVFGEQSYFVFEKADKPYSKLSHGAEAVIFMAGAMLLGYLIWVIVREIYIRVAIWAEERDEGVFLN